MSFIFVCHTDKLHGMFKVVCQALAVIVGVSFFSPCKAEIYMRASSTEQPSSAQIHAFSPGPLLSAVGSPGSVHVYKEGEPLDTKYLHDYSETRGFSLGRPVKAKPTPDGKAVLFLRAEARSPRQSLYIFDVQTGQTTELLTPEKVLKGAAENLSAEEKARRERQRISVAGFADFQISDDGRLVLVTLSGKLYILTRATGAIAELKTGNAAIIDPKFSPDSKSVSYVSNYDLHVIDLSSGQSRQITNGGSEILTHGLTEFVAQEEMGRFTGYWWSPESDQIVYQESDAKGVEVWYVADPEHPDQVPVPQFYPRPGKANVKTRMGVTAPGSSTTTWLKWDADKYPYVASVSWTKQGPLCLIVETRDQKEIVLLKADPTTGKTSPLLSEKDKDWINLQIYDGLPDWLEGSNGFLWATERDGGPALELRDAQGGFIRTLVSAKEGFLARRDSDGNSRTVSYLASPDPRIVQLFRIGLDGGKPTKLSTQSGVDFATYSKDHSIYALASSSLDKMTKTSIHKDDGTLIGALPSVAEDPPVVPRAEMVCVQRISPEKTEQHSDALLNKQSATNHSDEFDNGLTADGSPKSFYACIVRPQNFDSNKKYPVIVDVYGGPGHNKVVSEERPWLLTQWLADQGFITVTIDGRGTPRRGRDWERRLYLHFGSVPLDDQVAGLQALGRQYPELDLSRVGMTGWSFGGYMSALAVLRRPDVFKAAVAGAPVVDWLDYDTHYTERYLGMPDTNPEAYQEGSLLTYAGGLKRPLLLVHGTTDDNVFFRHSLKLSNALFRAGAPFEILPLSGLTHMVPDAVVTQRLWSKIADFFHEHL